MVPHRNFQESEFDFVAQGILHYFTGSEDNKACKNMKSKYNLDFCPVNPDAVPGIWACSH